MNCSTAESMVNRYINRTLSVEELEDFLEHIKKCPDCYDELETYYTITVGMKYLEEERLEAYNIPHMLKEDLRKKERYVRWVHAFTGTLFAIGLILVISFVILILLYLGRIELPILFK